MAGGKETPRQKMISLMYLVLTALLAMNVSTTVLDKFAFIDMSLLRSVGESETRNIQTIESITKAIDDTGNRESDLAILKFANELRQKTAEVQGKIDGFRETFIEMTGGWDEDFPGDLTHIPGKTDYDKVGNYMLDVEQDGQGHGKELQKILNDYALFVQKELIAGGGIAKAKVATSFPLLALDANDNPSFNKDPNQQDKSFSDVYFHSTPTGAGLATLSDFKSKVSGYESRALKLLADKIGAGDLKFDKIVADVKAESQVVAAGTKYRAQMFVAASSSGVSPKMFYNGREIPVTDGKGLVEFTAKPGKYDSEGMSKQKYKAEISVPRPGMTDTVFTNEIEYIVAKPVIQIQSASVQALYLGCGNELDVQVPALGRAYKPSFTAKGASVYPGKGGRVTLVPASANVTLNVASNGNPVGKQDFKVRRIPKPEIKAVYKGRPVDMKKGLKGPVKSLKLVAAPDESFLKFLPKDARFEVSAAEVVLVRSGRSVKSVKMGSKANLSGLSGQMRAGDVLVIEVKRVKRKNFRGVVEDFNNFGPRILRISIR